MQSIFQIRRLKARSLSSVCFAALAALVAASGSAQAQVAPLFTTDGPFGIVSSTYTNTAAGTTVNGDVCFTTGPAVTPTINGASGACPAGTGGDQTSATATIMTQPCVAISGPLEGVVIGANPPGFFTPGCYTSVGALNITANGIVTLSGNGVFVFRSTGGAITTGANSVVQLAGGACAGNVFWSAVGATNLGGASTFVGSILDAAGISLGLGATMTGRALAFGGTVGTLGSNTITVPVACAALAPPTLTVTKVSNGGVGSFTFTGNNGFGPQTITTVTPGTGVSGAPVTLATAGTITTITEAASATAFSPVSCTGLGAGGTTVTNLAARTVTLDALATSAGSIITCTFTNTFAGAVVGGGAAIPTLSEWGMILLASLLAFAGLHAVRRR